MCFTDYCRPSIRLGALMGIRVIYVMTHDSIGLGEDGPTHQPVEHVASLRLIPGMDVWRPGDAAETAASWVAALGRADGPSVLALSRQNLTPIKRSSEALANISKGGYVAADAAGARAVIVATGSEVSVALAAQAQLSAAGVPVRAVSMPCTSVFDRQDAAYRESVLPRGLPRVAVEAGIADYWWKYVGLEGAVVGMDRFGESAPAGELFRHFGFTADNVAKAVRSILS